MHMPVGRKKALAKLVDHLDEPADGGGPRLDAPEVQASLADLYRDLLVGWLLSYKVVWLQETGQNATGFASYQKVFNAEAGERLAHGAMAMLGDLFSSFVKRRLNLSPGSRATGLDQIPESLFPLLACRNLLSLTIADIGVCVAIFFVGEVLLSRLLFAVRLRDRPY